jgi:hypothetical protein
MHKAVIDSAPDAGVWHHFALAYNKQKIKCYVDTNEVLYISNCGYIPTRFILSCNNGDRKVMYANIRLATGRFVTTYPPHEPRVANAGLWCRGCVTVLAF